MTQILFKTLISYIVLMLTIRLMGKRQLGQMQVSELISAFMISEIAAASITSADITTRDSILSMAMILILEIVIPFLSSKIPKLRKVIDGVPSYLIYNGSIDPTALKKARMTIDELGVALRVKGFPDISKIRYAILENNGSISAFPYEKELPLTPKQAKISVSDEGISHFLIIDGFINTSALKETNMKKAELDVILNAHGVKPKNVYLLSIDDQAKVTLIKKHSQNNR